MTANALTSRSYERRRGTVLELHGVLTAATVLKVEPELAKLLAKASRPWCWILPVYARSTAPA